MSGKLHFKTIHNGVRIHRWWFEAKILWQAPLGFLWTYLLVRAAKTLLLYTPDAARGYIELPLAIAVGAVYALLTVSGYLAIAQTLLNRTTVTATPRQLRVSHGIVPGEERHDLGGRQVRQLICVQAPGWLRPRWDLIAVLRGGHRRTLIRRRPLEEVLRIERAVEKAMGIRDIPRPPSALQPKPFWGDKAITEPLLKGRLDQAVTDDRLVLSWRWFNPSAFAIVGVLAVLFIANLPEALQTVHDVFVPRGVPTPSLLGPLARLTGALALGYGVLAFVLNRTFVSAVRGGTLAVRHGPVPLLPGVTVAAPEVRQLFVQTPGLDYPGGAVYVRALLAGGRRVTLAKAPDAEAAVVIERELERWLDIKDELVPRPSADV